MSKPRDALNQRLRFRRYLLASAVSVVYLAALGVFHWQEKVDTFTLLGACTIVAALIVVFFGLFRSGLNRRFPDASLTSLQILAAVATMLFVVYRAPDTRLVFAAFFFVAMMFGMLRSGGLELAAIGFVCLVSYALVAFARYGDARDVDVLRLDMLQLVAMVVTFPWFVFIGTLVRRLQEADRRKDEFLATLAHELRNPLAPIRTGVEILRMTDADPRSQSVVAMLERQLTQVMRLVDDLSDLSRIGRGKMALHVERVDIRRIACAAVEASRPLIAQMDHDLVVSMPPDPLVVDGDPARLSQVISNLLNNAARYTAPGGRISLDAARRGDESVEIVVSDTGIGIPADKLGSIFEMFAQVGGASSQAGLGIGLSLVKRLVELHGGSIVANSKGLGQGSEFRVVLPARGSKERVEFAHTAPGAARRHAKVLVVDDNRDAASSVAVLLELMGHDVRSAHAAETALALAVEFRPEVVLLDLGMPGADGYETCRRIRTQPGGESITVIAITHRGQDDDTARRAAGAGFDLHLVKPVTRDMLERLFDEVHTTA